MVLHGEVSLVKVNSIPKDAKKVSPHGKFFIVADSETSGNHHVVDLIDEMEIYEKDGKFYVKNERPTQVRCLMTERHDNVVLEPAIWEIDKQQEYDYFTESHRNVAD